MEIACLLLSLVFRVLISAEVEGEEERKCRGMMKGKEEKAER